MRNPLFFTIIILFSITILGCKTYQKDSIGNKYYWFNKFHRAPFNPKQNTQGIYYYTKIRSVSLIDSSFFSINQLNKPLSEARYFYLKITIENIEVFMQESGMREMAKIHNVVCNDTLKLTHLLKSRDSRMEVNVLYYPILNPKEIKTIRKIIKKNKPVLILVNPNNPHNLSICFAYVIYPNGKFDLKKLLPYETIFHKDFNK